MDNEWYSIFAEVVFGAEITGKVLARKSGSTAGDRMAYTERDIEVRTLGDLLESAYSFDSKNLERHTGLKENGSLPITDPDTKLYGVKFPWPISLVKPVVLGWGSIVITLGVQPMYDAERVWVGNVYKIVDDVQYADSIGVTVQAHKENWEDRVRRAWDA